MIYAYVLIEAEPTRVQDLIKELPDMELDGSVIKQVHAVTGRYDLIAFKSMLHDWPGQDMRQFIDKAAQALEPGGTILIFERGPLRVDATVPPMSMLPMQATTSATIRPRHMSSSACKLMSEGGRTRVRFGMAVPEHVAIPELIITPSAYGFI